MVEGLDPMNLAGPFNLALMHLALGQYDQTAAAARRVQKLQPGFVMTQGMIGAALLFQGDSEAALQTLLLEEKPAFVEPYVSMAHYASGRVAESDIALARAVELDSEPILIAQAYVHRGDLDSAFEWLRRGLESGRLHEIGDISLDPAWRSLVEDPRSAPLLSEYGLATEQLAALEFKIALPQIGG